MTRIGSIGECKLVDWDVDASFYVSLALLKVHGALPDFVAHYSNSVSFKRQVELHSLASAIPKKINLGPISEVLVALPPTAAEQSAIATALSDVDALLAAQDALIAKKRAIKQGAMQELLTGKRRLPGFGGEWEVRRLGDVARIQKGQVITPRTLTPGTIPVIAGGKRPAYFHSEANRQSRTITISASGASAGYVAFHSNPIFASDCSTIVESGTCCVEFLFHALQLRQDQIYLSQTGGAQPHVQPKDLAPILVDLPVSRAEQAAVADVLADMDAEIAKLEAKRAKTAQLKQGMMQALLTGRIRLV